MSDNTSGMKKESTVPDSVKRWSWGGFTLGWIWGIFNGTWIALLGLIPYVGLVMAVILGLKGNEWAWRNKTWESEERFHAVQKKWAIFGLLFVALLIASVISVPILLQSRNNG